MGEGVSRTEIPIPCARSRVRLLTAAVLAALASAPLVSAGHAQTTAAKEPQSAAEAAKRLETQRSELEAKKARDRQLQNDLTNIAVDSKEINQRLIDTAALVQKSEEQMTAIEDRLSGFETQERDLRGSLAKEHGRISGLLAALQRMGRNPPPVIITRREDALQMVRSAMLLGVAFPSMREDARVLATKLKDLVAIMDSIRHEGERLRAERDRLSATQTQLSSLLETKRQSLADRQAELKQVREAAAQISKNVNNLSELIAKLSQQVNTAPLVQEAEAQPAGSGVVAVLPPSGLGAAEAASQTVARDAALETAAAAPQRTEEVAMLAPPVTRDAPSSIVEMAPAPATLIPGKPDRITPAVAFHLAKGKLPLPARGRIALGFGDKTQYGGTSKGIVIETRFGGRVISPCDGWVVYAGEFRSYGQLLIINAGGGYHVLVAGLSQMDVGPGQFVLAAEPIGTMSSAPRTAQLASDKTRLDQSVSPTSAPVLYIEFRKEGQPIDSDPWWAAPLQKAQE